MSTGYQIYGLFQRRLGGDSALVELLCLRFAQMGIAAEIYPKGIDRLEVLLSYAPKGLPVMAHLPRDGNLLEQARFDEVLAYARAGQGRVRGLVLHDQPEAVTKRDAYIDALKRLDCELSALDRPPMIFVEYAAMLPIEAFVEMHESLVDCASISACIDIGHAGLYAARREFTRLCPHVELQSLSPLSAELPQVVAQVQQACASALPAVIDLVRALGMLGKPLHFHLHDAHPLVRTEPYGLSDHMGFLSCVHVPFEHEGRRALGTLFGLGGLEAIVREALSSRAPEVGFSLEIHPNGSRQPLGLDAEGFFKHWADKENAERMNGWLDLIEQNALLLRQCIKRYEEGAC